jgi:hypothetical protein
MALAPLAIRDGTLEIETSSCRSAGVISRQTSSANVRPYAVDCAGRRDPYLSHKRRTAISDASHASKVVVDIRAGDSIEISRAFQCKARPLGRK